MLAGGDDLVVVNSCGGNLEALRTTRQAIRRPAARPPRVAGHRLCRRTDRATIAAMPEVDGPSPMPPSSIRARNLAPARAVRPATAHPRFRHGP